MGASSVDAWTIHANGKHVIAGLTDTRLHDSDFFKARALQPPACRGCRRPLAPPDRQGQMRC